MSHFNTIQNNTCKFKDRNSLPLLSAISSSFCFTVILSNFIHGSSFMVKKMLSAVFKSSGHDLAEISRIIFIPITSINQILAIASAYICNCIDLY